jgi:hypothetical protein
VQVLVDWCFTAALQRRHISRLDAQLRPPPVPALGIVPEAKEEEKGGESIGAAQSLMKT